MSDTPLSDLLEAYIASPSPQAIVRLVDGFRQSRVGVVIADGAPGAAGLVDAPAGPSMSFGFSINGEGRSFVLVFADPIVFRQRVGARFNGVMLGSDVIDVMLLRDDCSGIRINSAKSTVSVTVPRPVFESLHHVDGDEDDLEG